jgi:hypothetical protein
MYHSKVCSSDSVGICLDSRRDRFFRIRPLRIIVFYLHLSAGIKGHVSAFIDPIFTYVWDKQFFKIQVTRKLVLFSDIIEKQIP